jgi:hypothetical protein
MLGRFFLASRKYSQDFFVIINPLEKSKFSVFTFYTLPLDKKNGYKLEVLELEKRFAHNY